jgi:hypothetical protein
MQLPQRVQFVVGCNIRRVDQAPHLQWLMAHMPAVVELGGLLWHNQWQLAQLRQQREVGACTTAQRDSGRQSAEAAWTRQQWQSGKSPTHPSLRPQGGSGTATRDRSVRELGRPSAVEHTSTAHKGQSTIADMYCCASRA